MDSSPLNGGKAVEFRCGQLRVTGKRWGKPGGMPVLALHGWLDNCASFDFLAPLLPTLDLVCIDAAGQGLSDARPHFGAYSLWQDVADLFEVARQLSWSEFSLIGHSRGAATALLAAGTFPEKIRHVNLIEGFFPKMEAAEAAPEILQEAISSLHGVRQRPRHYYRSFEETVTARARGLVPVNQVDAQVLARYGVQQDERGYFWHYDYGHMAPVEIRYSQAQVDAFIRRIQARTCLVQASSGLLVQDPASMRRIEALAFVQRIELPGSHHLHMSEQYRAVAEIINLQLHSNGNPQS